jgi:hypothetical protein
MVIRASAGLFYNRSTNNVPGSGAPPVVYTPTLYYSSISGIPQAAANAVITPTAASAIYGPQKLERTHQWNLTIQRDIGFQTVVDVGYVGNFDRNARYVATPGSNTDAAVQLNPVPYQAYANPANLFNNTEINANLVRTAYPGLGASNYRASAFRRELSRAGIGPYRLTHGLAFGAAPPSPALGTQNRSVHEPAAMVLRASARIDAHADFELRYTLPTFGAQSKILGAAGRWTVSASAW